MAEDFDGRDTRGGLLPESIRKALVSGISAVFMTEEGIRNMLSDMRLPKDAMAYLVQQTERTRRELFRVISHELKAFLKNADLTHELRRAMRDMRVQIRAEVRFADGSEPPETDIKARVKRREAPQSPPAKRPKRRKATRP